MIKIEDKKDCCGCSSCVQVCPQKCISFTEDREGFSYPKVNHKQCSECGLCEKVCPILQNKNKSVQQPIKVYAAKNKKEDIRRHSSSGGIFTLLAEETIKQGGVVFGARFDEKWDVVHDYTETIDGLASFRGSKYVQSRIGDNYLKARTILKEGRKVLFSGTPCQIAGLKSFLRKEYENLLCVDFVCHGIPSPKVWHYYLKSYSNNKNRIDNINFRDKTHGWKNYSIVISLSTKTTVEEKDTVSQSKIFKKDPFMNVFLQNVSIRPSCYDCRFRSLKSGADITIGDFWGIEKINHAFDDDKGVSLVIINTEKGKGSFNINEAIIEEHSFQEACQYNNSLIKSSASHPFRSLFFFFLPLCNNVEFLSKKCLGYKHNILYRVYKKIHSLLIIK